jgi:hypothetical protein
LFFLWWSAWALRKQQDDKERGNASDDREVTIGTTDELTAVQSPSAASAFLEKRTVTNRESHVAGFLPHSTGTTLHRLRDFSDRSFGFGVLTQLFFVCLCP